MSARSAFVTPRLASMWYEVTLTSHHDLGNATQRLVMRGEVKVGDLLERGKPIVEIAEQKGFCFEAAIPSAEIGHLRLGMPVRIKLDAYDYQRYGTVAGTVVSIAPDSGVLEDKSCKHSFR